MSWVPVILANHEAEIRRIMVQNQPQANSSQDPISKTPLRKKRAGGVAQVVDPEFKSHTSKKKNKISFHFCRQMLCSVTFHMTLD
jgi:hypothetical protein